MEDATRQAIFNELDFVEHALPKIRAALVEEKLHDARAYTREVKQIFDNTYGTLNVLVRYES